MSTKKVLAVPYNSMQVYLQARIEMQNMCFADLVWHAFQGWWPACDCVLRDSWKGAVQSGKFNVGCWGDG